MDAAAAAAVGTWSLLLVCTVRGVNPSFRVVSCPVRSGPGGDDNAAGGGGGSGRQPAVALFF